MKVKNLYYHTVFKRTNMFKMTMLSFFLAICSWPRVFIEVFTRKHFGERYFLFPLCLFLGAALSIVPFFRSYGQSFISVILHNITWYAFDVIFLIHSFRRYKEVKREPGVYDFKKFSLSPGIINSWFYNLDIFGINLTSRVISIYIEPGLFFIAGLILALLQLPIGDLLVLCSLIYSGSWAAQYYLGDQFIMDTIDEMICNEELVNSFVHNRNPSETKGFEVFGERPRGMDFRRKVAENMIEDEPAVDVH